MNKLFFRIAKERARRREKTGFITVDYLFSFFLVAGFSMVIIAFSATLSMVEVVQYIAYSTARNFFAGNVDPASQLSTAETKLYTGGVNSLLGNPLIKPLVSGGWFSVNGSSAVISGDITSNSPFANYNPTAGHNMFEGVMIPFSANILAMQIPFFGSTMRTTQTPSTAFQTNITAFLGREPTFSECAAFNQARWAAIQQLSKAYSSGSYSSSYIVFNDNGC
jgi:hypothetical protein